MIYTADFETTTEKMFFERNGRRYYQKFTDSKVWAMGVYNLATKEYNWGNTIDDFFKFCEEVGEGVFYFHNLKFDGGFILPWLFNNNYKHVVGRIKEEGTFTTLISDKGQWYAIEIFFHNGSKIKIQDSLKLIPFPVEKIAKDFDLPISKLSIPYDKYRKEGQALSQDEIEYLKNDVVIVGEALKKMFEMGIDKMTIGSSALEEYKKVVGKKYFKKWFPIPSYDHDIRQSYKGGWTYCDPRTKGQDINNGLVFDVNSLYPSRMDKCLLPYGEGKFFTGGYEYDKQYPLYVQTLKCQFELKENHLPTIQIKGGRFIETEYLESSGEEEVTLCLTSVDLELFFEHYEVYNLEFINGWKFRGCYGMFTKYIEKWNGIKVKANEDGNEAMRTIAKLMLNNIYGKFALNPVVKSKIPNIGKDGVIKYSVGEAEERDPIYIPVGTFITAYARHMTITSAQKLFPYFCYADTDSLHLRCLEGQTVEELLKICEDTIEIDKSELGKWKHESTFTRARFLRQKTYIEEIKEKLHITCAGMPKKCYEHVNWNNFQPRLSVKGKLSPKTVKHGVLLMETYFTIKA